MARNGLLSFTEQRTALAAALDRIAGTGGGRVTASDGVGVSAQMVITSGELDIIAADRTLRSKLNRVLKNLGTLGVRRIQQVIRRFNAIDTRLFISSWKHKRVDEGVGFNVAVVFTNDAPYAKYVHPKGTPRSRTILNTDIKGEIIPGLAIELRDDIDRVLRPAIAKKVKADILRRSR